MVHLHTVRLVQDRRLPLDALQDGLVFSEQLVAGEQHVEAVVPAAFRGGGEPELVAPYEGPIRLIARVQHHILQTQLGHI